MRTWSVILIIVGCLLIVINVILRFFEHDATGLFSGGIALVIAGLCLFQGARRKKKLLDK